MPITQINWGGHKTTVGGVFIFECLPVTQINWGSDNILLVPVFITLTDKLIIITQIHCCGQSCTK